MVLKIGYRDQRCGGIKTAGKDRSYAVLSVQANL
jgi:hypothetical protein